MVCEGIAGGTGGSYVAFNPNESYTTKTRKLDGKPQEIAFQNGRAYVNAKGAWIEVDKIKKGNIFHKSQYAFNTDKFKAYVNDRLQSETEPDWRRIPFEEVCGDLPPGFKIEIQKKIQQ